MSPGAPAGGRRRSREIALKLLYQVRMGGGSLDEACDGFEEYLAVPEHVRAFARELAKGTIERVADVDEALREAITGWDMDRLAALDRELLRLASYELLFCDDIPARGTINEAIEISREYSTAESTKFVNGVLDAVAAKRAPRKL